MHKFNEELFPIMKFWIIYEYGDFEVFGDINEYKYQSGSCILKTLNLLASSSSICQFTHYNIIYEGYLDLRLYGSLLKERESS